MNRFVWLVVCFVHTIIVSGQNQKGISDTIFQIPEVLFSVNRIDNFSTGNKVQRIDSALLSSYSTTNLSQALSACTGIQINSYGTGLSSASLRGTGSSHTAVIWNGLNIQDILNGGVDFSLIPTGFFDNIKVQYGGNGALFGSGCIGGAIHLNNSLDFNKGFNTSFRTAYGSYGHFYEGLNLSYSNKLFLGFVKTYYNKAQNDYKFRNTEEFGTPIQTLHNADYKEFGILAGAAVKINDRNRFETSFWYLNNDKNIGQTMVASNLSNNQNKSYRTSSAWKYRHNSININIRSGFVNNIFYYNPINSNLSNSKHRSLSLVNESELIFKPNENHLVNLGLNYTFEKAISTDLNNNPDRNRYSIFSSYRFISNNSKWNVVTSFREELLNKLVPLTFTFGMERQITHVLRVKGKVSRNYRIPTLNDLYWNFDGFAKGNADLKSESGIGQDLGIVFTKQFQTFTLGYECSGFSNIVNGWILWHPNGDNIWTPDNVSKVWARGIEQDLSFQFTFDQVTIKPSASYSYTRSTKIIADMPGDDGFHKQLIYVPIHKAGFKVLLEYDGFYFYYGQNYMGRRYTLVNNSKYIAAFSVGDISLSKVITIRNQQVNFTLLVNNLWNTVYQVMQYYPTPHRNYQVSIQLNFK